MIDRRVFLQRSAWVAVGGLFLPNVGLVFGDEAVEAFAQLTPQPSSVFAGFPTYADSGWFRHEFFSTANGGYAAEMFAVCGKNIARPFGHGWQRILSHDVSATGKSRHPAPYLPAPHVFRDPHRLLA